MFKFSSQKGKFPGVKRVLPVFFISAVVFGLLLSACDLDDDDPYEDPFELNPGLIGTWEASGQGWTDTYKITATTLEHVNNFTSKIVYTYNFSENAGVIIIEYVEKPTYFDHHYNDDGTYINSDNPHEPTGNFSAVYFSALTESAAYLGAAYVYADYTQQVEAGSLNEAKEKFKPANADLYGGGTGQGGDPLEKINSSL
ncbi:hypothetical protein [Leadbettera azotonutricia]|uniref:Lipoprotein n=1 Tax=Leadbettera azotonutricia (strain ATCC BAA-888 / DSM 13862 / ZAS-9) TaxID=545695 RepID=F5Y851_LEAAZ|nr:hypothetical protein [Leadbettera azotonutricia]AEF81441.1 hypothetical protein TREAZ_2254 [Leadbettera azotonutricia ZAS-9]